MEFRTYGFVKRFKVVSVVLAVAALLLFTQSAVLGAEEEYLSRYSADISVRQLVLVEQIDGSKANLRLYVKENDSWKYKMQCDAFIGKAGTGKTKEGDMKTPLGDYKFTMAFGIKDDPGSKIAYTKLTDSMYWCGDREYYNRFVDTSKIQHQCSESSEHLIEYTKAYAYALALDYNKENEWGKGSGIFLHCCGNHEYTAGCVAVPEDDMIEILRTVEPNAHICIYKAN